jgi:hypothetical protein
MIDPAINALTACPGDSPETIAMTLPEICRFFNGIREVECRYEFELAWVADPVVLAAGTRTFKRSKERGTPPIAERDLVCPHALYEDASMIDDESDWVFGIVGGGFDLRAGNPNFHKFTGGQYFPLFGDKFFTWIGNDNPGEEIEFFLSTYPDLDVLFPEITKYDGVGTGKFIIHDKDGLPVEHEFNIYSYYEDLRDDKSDTSFQPWGVKVDDSGFVFELEVVKWFTYNGAYDEDTGELLVPDAIRP